MIRSSASPVVKSTAEGSLYDLVIIGGGVYGAALCCAATQRRLKVALFEKNDFCSGASSNSLKTVHGGIRYLQTFNLPRTLDSIRARNQLLKLFGHGMQPMRCLMPTYLVSMKNPQFVRLGFTFYNLLSRLLSRGGNPKYWQATTIGKKDVEGGFLNTIGHIGFACWFDPQLQYPERVVIDLLMTARDRGAEIYNYVSVKGVGETSASFQELWVEDGLLSSSESIGVKGRLIVDCSGGGEVFSAEAGDGKTQYVRAVNLVLSLPEKPDAYTAFTQRELGGRLLFFCPWQEKTMVGTWYFPCDSSSTKPEDLAQSEIHAILADINSVSDVTVGIADILHIHIGLLPANTDQIGKTGDLNASLASNTQCFNSKDYPRLYRVEGIKFTTALYEAEKTLSTMIAKVDLVTEEGQKVIVNSSVSDVAQLAIKLSQQYAWCGSEIIERLILVYGANSNKILSLCLACEGLKAGIPGVKHSLMAELDYVCQHENAQSLSDVLLRRIVVGGGGVPDADTIRAVACRMAELEGWTEAEITYQYQLLFDQYHPLLAGRKKAEEALLSSTP